MALGLTPLEIEALHETFKAFDKNGNGMIEASELQTLLRQLGHTATHDEAQQFINMIDYDGNGVITFNEFVLVMSQRLRDAQHERKMLEAFKFFDKDNSGYITAEELKSVLDSIGEKLSKAEIEEIIRQADVDGDHTINYQEFVRFIMQA